VSTSSFLDALYIAGLTVSSPYYACRMIGSDAYRSGLAERWGRLPDGFRVDDTIWMHCSSVGETMLTRKLVPELEDELPEYHVALSSSTEAGYNTALSCFPNRRVFRHPLDLSWVVRRVLRAVNPKVLVLVEREIWPQLVLAAASESVPVALVNGRGVSERSLWWYRRFGSITKRALRAISLYLVQSDRDAECYSTLGVPDNRIHVAGNLKYDNVTVGFDRLASEDLLSKIGWQTGSTVFVAGSTHEGEEQSILRSYRELRCEHSGLKLVVAPRYVDRAAQVAQLLQEAELSFVRWSEIKTGRGSGHGCEVVLVDTIGDLTSLYAIATVVFVGGSLIAHGGHNVIEPAALGRPVLIGPHYENTAEAVEFLVEAKAVCVVDDSSSMTVAARSFLDCALRAESVGKAGQRSIRQRQGSCAQHVSFLKAWLHDSFNTEGARRT